MHAALVESFDEPPHHRCVPEPVADAGREVAEVLAVGVHPATRGVAAGAHYTSAEALPITAGVDGVVRRPDGALAYVMAPRTGTLAERIAIDPASAIPLPAGADPAVVAATMNPALSSWIVLRVRVPFAAGRSVLVMGATGKAGSMAVKVARHLGAGRVVAAGRDRARLDELLSEGADEAVALGGDAAGSALAAAAAEVDVVIDYVWGPPTELAMRAILEARTEHARPLDWVQVGDRGGSAITVQGFTLQSNAIRISGSGYGTAPPDVYQQELAGLATAISAGTMQVRPRQVPLAEVEQAWTHADTHDERTVLVPCA